MNYYTYMYLREDGTPYYIGKGKGVRAFKNQCHFAKPPKDRARIVKQYWESEEKAFEVEKWYISFFGRKDNGTGILRNLTNGGEGVSGCRPSEETKEKIREARKRQKYTEETREKVRASLKGNTNALGYKHSEDSSRKMKENAVGNHVRWHLTRNTFNPECRWCRQ